MSQIDQLKEAIENISKKKHVISSEATYAKEVINSNKEQVQEEAKHSLERQQLLLNEFNTSIQLLMKIFKQSRFDEVLGFVAEPYKLILINSIIAFFKGLFFALGFAVMLLLLASSIDLSSFGL